MKHSCLINGYDTLNLTKLDVLDGLSEIKIAVGYTVDGKELHGFPGRSYNLTWRRNRSTNKIYNQPTWESSQPSRYLTLLSLVGKNLSPPSPRSMRFLKIVKSILHS